MAGDLGATLGAEGWTVPGTAGSTTNLQTAAEMGESLGGSGWSVPGTAGDVSNLGTGGNINAQLTAQGWDVRFEPSPTFALDFARDQYSTLSPALTVSSPTGGVMVPDYLGNYHKALAGEIPIRGGRRVLALAPQVDQWGAWGSKSYEEVDNGFFRCYTDGSTLAQPINFNLTQDSIRPAWRIYLRGTDTSSRISIGLYNGSFISVTPVVVSGPGSITGTTLLQVQGLQDGVETVLEITANGYTTGGVWTTAFLYFDTRSGSGNPATVVYNDVKIGLIEGMTPGQAVMNPEDVSLGVLSSPYHGYGVDGLAWMRTDPSGLALADAASGYSVLCTGIADWPEITNLSKKFELWSGSVGTEMETDDAYGLPMRVLTSAGSAETSRRQTIGLAGSTAHTAHGFFVAGTAPYAYVRALSVVGGGAIAADGVWFDLVSLSASAVGTGITSATIVEELPGLLKWTITFTTAPSPPNNLFDIGQSNASGALTSTSGHTLTICDYVQIETGSVANPLVPTDTVAVTADAIVKTLDDSLIGWVAGGGTLIVEQTPEQDASTGDILIDIKTDADNRILVSGASGNTQLLVRDSATDVATINGTGWQAGVTQRVAAKIEADDAELVIDGSSEGTDTSLTVPAITTITLGGGQAKSIGAIAYYAAGA